MAIMPSQEAEDAMRPHLIWELQQVMSHIEPNNLTASELMAMLSVLIVPHARWLRGDALPSGQPGRVQLRAVHSWTS
jgi:hypothetical protein